MTSPHGKGTKPGNGDASRCQQCCRGSCNLLKSCVQNTPSWLTPRCFPEDVRETLVSWESQLRWQPDTLTSASKLLPRREGSPTNRAPSGRCPWRCRPRAPPVLEKAAPQNPTTAARHAPQTREERGRRQEHREALTALSHGCRFADGPSRMKHSTCARTHAGSGAPRCQGPPQGPPQRPP